MNIYFNGITNQSSIDFKQIDTSVNGYAVFNLEITEHEGQFPTATVLIQNPYRGLLNPDYPRHAVISVHQGQQLNVIFVGQIIGVPNHIDGEMMEIMLMAKPTDSLKQIAQLQAMLAQTSSVDDLFLAKDSHRDLSENLDGRMDLPYWSRCGEPLRLSNIFWGSTRHVLGHHFFRDKLKFKSIGQPLSSVCVTLKMEWVQKYRGRTNISHLLNSYFPQGLISTFTGKNLQSKWWKKDEVLGRTGYWIEQSQLKPMQSLSTGILQLYPAYSPPITLSPHDPLNQSGQPEEIKVKRSWFQAKLILGWLYRQKRIEKVRFTLKNWLQVSPDSATRSRNLDINLQPFINEQQSVRQWQSGILYQPDDRVTANNRLYQAIRSHLSGSKLDDDLAYWQEMIDNPITRQAAQQAGFFNTARGHQAIGHAIKIATAHLAASTRAVELSLQAPFEALMHLTCDHSVQIIDERLPGGQAWGKVKALRLVVEGQTGRLWGELKLLSSIGFDTIHDPSKSELNTDSVATPQIQLYCEENYSVNSLAVDTVHRLSSDHVIGYDRNRMHGPTEGILYPEQLSAYDIVSSVKILNGPEQQSESLVDNQYPARHNLAGVLAENRTEIILRLKDLQPLPSLEHQMELVITDDWTAPQQINLQAPKQNH